MSERPTSITKVLSQNDTGETGGHQAGILVPREDNLLAFFPPLDAAQYNPRHKLFFIDPHGKKWEFSFIYYNNKFFNGTRNEYRLTCMTPFLRAHNLKAGDTLVFARDEENRFHISYRRQNEPFQGGVLRLGNTWRVVGIGD